jgi:hypothetical protein
MILFACCSVWTYIKLLNEYIELEVDEKITLKATEYDKYKHISGSVWACSWAVMEMHITWKYRRFSLIKPVHEQ